ncbi:MAG: hypothetical protein IKZ73_05365 [Lachnospiraceae bacterium]|nr:hypothetical protein [Lachnospiraceae bacterium]
MRKRILEYRRMMDELLTKLEEGSKDVDITALKTEHMNQISFFQHERLIHLIVTVLFAILEFMAFLFVLIMPNIGTILLTFAVLILLIPYIRHYYLLENEVQKMYVQYDRIVKLLNNNTCLLK